MAGEPKKSLAKKAEEEAKAFLPVFLYVWFLLAMLGLHKSIVLSQAHIVQHQGFAVAKALAFSKMVFVWNEWGLGRNFDHKPLIAPVLFKSALFGVLLIAMDLLEQALLERFWPAHASADAVDLSNWRMLLSLGVVTFAALIPFFGFREFAKVVGEAEMRKLMFVRREQLVPVREAGPAPAQNEPAPSAFTQSPDRSFPSAPARAASAASGSAETPD
ncbi:hypothetical protein V3H18_05995 [Methylocystis sp. 9N]|uniref:Uncharacterized protein n=1 Tax=Methylocystis borbori TaxID=3118750 RepID=A0ABU7XG65_9HYPH